MEDLKILLQNWYGHNNGHPEDDKQFYDIVIRSELQKISESIFEEVIPEDKVDSVYKRYEDLHSFLLHYKK